MFPFNKNELTCIHGIYDLPDDIDFFIKNKDCYSIIVQADHSTFPESIAPAGEPMTVQIQALHKIIEKTMNANSKFVTSFLNIDQFK